jgi:hypothetical protein
MLATIEAIDRELACGNLYRGHPDDFGSREQGAFLARSF